MKCSFFRKPDEDKTRWKCLDGVAARGIPRGIRWLCGHLSKGGGRSGVCAKERLFQAWSCWGQVTNHSRALLRAWINPRERGQLLPCQPLPIPGTPQGLLCDLGPRNLGGILNSHKSPLAAPFCPAPFGVWVAPESSGEMRA